MIYMIVYPTRGNGITQKSWEYIKVIGDHINANHCYSLMVYALLFSQLVANLDGIPFWRIVYLDGVIEIYSLAKCDDGEPSIYPFMTIQKKEPI